MVAQQVLAIQNAKKAGLESFQFPGDPQQVILKPCCGFFITMNPGACVRARVDACVQLWMMIGCIYHLYT